MNTSIPRYIQYAILKNIRSITTIVPATNVSSLPEGRYYRRASNRRRVSRSRERIHRTAIKKPNFSATMLASSSYGNTPLGSSLNPVNRNPIGFNPTTGLSGVNATRVTRNSKSYLSNTGRRSFGTRARGISSAARSNNINNVSNNTSINSSRKSSDANTNTSLNIDINGSANIDTNTSSNAEVKTRIKADTSTNTSNNNRGNNNNRGKNNKRDNTIDSNTKNTNTTTNTTSNGRKTQVKKNSTSNTSPKASSSNGQLKRKNSDSQRSTIVQSSSLNRIKHKKYEQVIAEEEKKGKHTDPESTHQKEFD